jgi:hypothetical protein
MGLDQLIIFLWCPEAKWCQWLIGRDAGWSNDGILRYCSCIYLKEVRETTQSFNHLVVNRSKTLDICCQASWLQVECHPYLNQSKLIAFCKERGIVITAYCPLGSPNSIAKADFPAPLNDPKLQEIAKKHGKSVAQIILRYLVSIYIFRFSSSFVN